MFDGTPALSSFTLELARLNARQHEAVTHPDGPLLVVAGPGTGKTQLLAARVAWLLTQPDARPQEILCLTYTDAAARNMRQRLLRFLGPVAHQVAVHTFHSLGQLIIQENADLLGQHELTAASELETDELLRELLDGLPAGHTLRRDTGNAYYDLTNLRSLFQTIKREGWTVPALLHELERYRLALPDDPQYQYRRANAAQGIRVGDVKHKELAAEENRIARTVAAAELFEAYQAGLATRQRFDYDDMLLWAIDLLTRHEHLRLNYQERWQHFLVDEYQDTNGAQSQLLYLLADFWEQPSITVVGDDDQSIYRFQGASLANVLDFRQRFPKAKVVVLDENYRSSAAVLTAAQGLIGRNLERLTRQIPGLNKQLTARHPRFAASTEPLSLRRYATPLHEAAHVAHELTMLHQAGTLPAGGVGVLVRNNGQLDLLAQLLRHAGVPFRRRRTVNVLAEEPLATSLGRVLRYVAAALLPDPGAAEPLLFEVLHLDCLHVPPTDLVRLAAGHLLHRRAAHAAGTAIRPWRGWAEEAARDDERAREMGLSAPGRAALCQALQLLDKWVQTAASRPVMALLEQVLLTTLLPTHLVRDARPDHLPAVAQTLLQFGRQEAQRQPGLMVAGLLRTWDALAATRDGLPLEQTSGAETALVELTTAHSAKGLEWERVWLLGCQQNIWLRKQADKGFRLPPALAPHPDDEAVCEEARRLFFVALTRAQEQLTVCWADHDESGRELVECRFVTELQQDGLPVAPVAVPDAMLAAAHLARLAPPPPPAPVPDPAVLDALLADFALSATTLDAYLTCPISCYYEHLLRVPVARNEHLLFGSAVHETLEQHFRQAQRHPNQQFDSADELATRFAARFGRYRTELPATTFGRYLQAGQNQLRAWWAHWQPTARPDSVVEYLVPRATLPGGPAITGKLDRLDLHPDGHGCDVLDYKTGNPTQARAHLQPAPVAAAHASLADWQRDERLRGGTYWRQGIFYHLLLRHATDRRYHPESVSFEYLRPVEKSGESPRFERFKVLLTPEAEATVRAQIQAVDAAIRNHEFGTGCGECGWCRLRAVPAD